MTWFETKYRFTNFVNCWLSNLKLQQIFLLLFLKPFFFWKLSFHVISGWILYQTVYNLLAICAFISQLINASFVELLPTCIVCDISIVTNYLKFIKINSLIFMCFLNFLRSIWLNIVFIILVSINLKKEIFNKFAMISNLFTFASFAILQ